MRVLHIKYPFLNWSRFWKQALFYDKRTCIGIFKSSPSARLNLEVLVTIARLNLRTVCIDSLLSYISLCFLFVFSYCKKWLSSLSHGISPYLHGKLINWTSAFYLSFCCTVLPRILNILIFIIGLSQLLVFVIYI